ncbi:MAG: 30S ribosomal protein S16 [Flavobacteriaceae bacterium]|nr:30S ribosomal protein S16 [Bacteroidia bacterium]MBT8287393.1 30S ribosomal protein S16 [Bacteroidia bacterium]NNF74028.1 30S ribosomal protein S16 [Flavobacteriaceae bacterium]NNK74116.1 30S ribosomal protein S16 [Flavobacteriaceae bacterium]
MPVKIRLQRHGKKGKPYYWIVAADVRSKRDGKYLEKLGAYNPNVNPAIIELDIDGAVKWLENGAQPTDTARAILSYKGAMLKKHLAGGVRKGALTEEEAEKKLNAWLEEKASKVQAKADGLAKAKADAKTKALEAEKAVSEARIAPVEIEEAAEAPEAEVATETTEAPEAEVAVEETEAAAETTETPEAEAVVEEAEATEAPKTEVAVEEAEAVEAPEAEVAVEEAEEAATEEKEDAQPAASNEEE